MTDTGTLLEDGGTSGSRSRRADGWLADIRISYDRVADSYSDYTRVAGWGALSARGVGVVRRSGPCRRRWPGGGYGLRARPCHCPPA